jgi:class 3 adenylate cyclase
MMSRARALLGRLTSSGENRRGAGVAPVAGILLSFTLGFAAILYYGLTHPDRAPFIDRDVLAMAFAIQTRIVVPGWAGLLLVGLLARKRWPDGRLLAHVTAQVCILTVAFFSYLLGFYTDLFGVMSLFVAATIGLLFFEARVVRAALLSLAGLVVAMTVAEQLGVLPYAPAFSAPPFAAGHFDTTWLLLFGGLNFLLLVGAAFVLIAAVQVAREREEKLRRATILIRRYVATQVAERILSGQHAEEGRPERRKLTIFFSDVVGFTRAADQMEAEDLAALLNEYLSEMAAIADSHGATVNQFVGDGIMAFFGAPDATEDRDHALRAVRMALEMQRRMVELAAKWFAGGIQTPFRIRIGINTGVSSVGDFGSKGRTTYSAIGTQTNLAARIQEHCEPGRVLISHTTWGLVRDEIGCEERGEIEFKGLHYPVRVYEVMEDAKSA